MLVLGSRDGSTSQRIVRTLKLSMFILNLRVGRCGATGKGKPESMLFSEIIVVVAGKGQVEPENKQSYLLSDWEDGSGGQRMLKFLK